MREYERVNQRSVRREDAMLLALKTEEGALTQDMCAASRSWNLPERMWPCTPILYSVLQNYKRINVLF